jgi:hypothetical protein
VAYKAKLEQLAQVVFKAKSAQQVRVAYKVKLEQPVRQVFKVKLVQLAQVVYKVKLELQVRQDLQVPQDHKDLQEQPVQVAFRAT